MAKTFFILFPNDHIYEGCYAELKADTLAKAKASAKKLYPTHKQVKETITKNKYSGGALNKK